MTTCDFDAPAESSEELEYSEDGDSDGEFFGEFKDFMLVDKECQTDCTEPDAPIKKKPVAKRKPVAHAIPIINDRFEVPEINTFIDHTRIMYGKNGQKIFKNVKQLEKEVLSKLNAIHLDGVKVNKKKKKLAENYSLK